ncbi:MAG: hypothetical protein FWD17_17275 [Polyangiaceae bacterium]|nr:hypothetical protein [Polyangiaceae bacterium]
MFLAGCGATTGLEVNPSHEGATSSSSSNVSVGASTSQIVKANSSSISVAASTSQIVKASSSSISVAASTSSAARSSSSSISVGASSETTDGAACSLSASNYDTSCAVDSDCVDYVTADSGVDYPVTFGDFFCSVDRCLCGGGPDAINTSSAAQLLKDIAATPLGSIPPPFCGCPIPVPRHGCCTQGQCTVVQGSPCPDLLPR